MSTCGGHFPQETWVQFPSQLEVFSGPVCANAAAQQNCSAQKKAGNTLQELSNWLKLPKMTQHVGESERHEFPNVIEFSSNMWRKLDVHWGGCNLSVSDRALTGHGLMQRSFIVPSFSSAFGEDRNNTLLTLLWRRTGSYTTALWVMVQGPDV